MQQLFADKNYVSVNQLQTVTLKECWEAPKCVNYKFSVKPTSAEAENVKQDPFFQFAVKPQPLTPVFAQQTTKSMVIREKLYDLDKLPKKPSTAVQQQTVKDFPRTKSRGVTNIVQKLPRAATTTFVPVSADAP